MKWIIIALMIWLQPIEEKQVLIRTTYYIDEDGVSKVMFENYTEKLNHDQAIKLLIEELNNINPSNKSRI